MNSSFISLWIQATSHGFKVYYLETNSVVYVHQREYCVCFLQVSVTSPHLLRNNGSHPWIGEWAYWASQAPWVRPKGPSSPSLPQYDSINFNFEKLIFAEVIVTGIFNKIILAIHAFWEKNYNLLVRQLGYRTSSKILTLKINMIHQQQPKKKKNYL